MKDAGIKLEGYDWEEAFSYAAACSPTLGAECQITSWGLADVAEFLGSDAGENDGPNWIAVVRLSDGRYGFLSAGCDYTGWDCQAGGYSTVSHSLDDLLLYGLGDDERDRLGIKL